MSQTIGRIASYFVFAMSILISVMIIGLVVNKSMNVYINDLTKEFVDESRMTGTVSYNNYMSYLQQITKLGSYRIDISYKEKLDMPQLNSQEGPIAKTEYIETSPKAVESNLYLIKQTIKGKEQYLPHNFAMASGDILRVTVTQMKGNFGIQMLKALTKIDSNKQIVSRYGGLVGQK